ncbi:MAG: thymidine phosphorylase, partial [Gammaproteobacteria bacterium]
DGRQPIGCGIGPALEARDVMAVLENDPDAPEDLRQKSLRLAGRILEFDPDVRGGQGYAIARDILDSGRALEKMRRIIARQGAKQAAPLGELTRDVVAEQDGVVTNIDNFHLAQLARRAGAPINPGAGIDLFKKLGDTVRKGEPLYRVYSSFRANHQFAEAFLAAHGSGYRIGSEAEIPLPFGLH